MKYSAATNMVCMEFDKFHQDHEGRIVPLFKMLFRIEVPRSDFTYVNAMNKIIELNEEYQFDWIGIDRGYGEVQLEMLHKYGMEHPETGLADKVIGYQFSQKIEVRDPYTKKKDQKHLKPFMVNNSVNIFEKGKIILDGSDKGMISQLEEYRVKSITSTGMPQFTDENEHAIDAMNLCLLLFALNYDSLLRKMYTMKSVFIGAIDKRELDVRDRSIGESQEEVPVIQVIRTSDKEKIITISPISQRRVNPRNKMYQRRSF